MRLLIALLLALALSSAYAADGTCKEFIVWNPTKNDTLFHFKRNPSDKTTKDGECYYNSGFTAKVVKWHCQNMYLVKDGTYELQKNHEGSISLRPFQFYCQSRW